MHQISSKQEYPSTKPGCTEDIDDVDSGIIISLYFIVHPFLRNTFHLPTIFLRYIQMK